MRWIAIAAGVLLVASVLVGSEEQAAEEHGRIVCTLEVNGQPHTIELGKLVTLPAQKGPLKVRLKVERVFRALGVEFRFPHEWKLSPTEDAWRLQGGLFTLHVSMRRGDPVRVMQWLEVVHILKTEDGKVIRNDRSLRLAGQKVAGTTYYKGLHNSIGTVRTYYALHTGPDTVLFTFTELRVDGLPGEPSAEWKEMERWLQESLKVSMPTSADK